MAFEKGAIFLGRVINNAGSPVGKVFQSLASLYKYVIIKV